MMENSPITLKKTSCVMLMVMFGIVCCKSQEISSNPHRGETYRLTMFEAMQGFAARTILKTIQVVDIFECLMQCSSYSRCRSVNFQLKGNPSNTCELSDISVVSSPFCQKQRPGYTYYYAPKGPFSSNISSCVVEDKECKNGGSCEVDECGRPFCKCQLYNKGSHCEQWTIDVLSCKDISNKTRYRSNGAYTILIDGKPTEIYCHLTDDVCGGGGWTMVIKMDGKLKTTFEYSSALWSNKDSYNLTAGQTGFDNYQTKMPSYWAMPFQKLCVGFKVTNVLKWAVIPYTGTSLYDVIADGRYKPFSVGRSVWMGMVPGSSLQLNCNQEGFNNHYHVRIGIRANQENDCYTCDSAIGFGLKISQFSCGNKCVIHCNNGNVDIAAFGYIMLQ